MPVGRSRPPRRRNAATGFYDMVNHHRSPDDVGLLEGWQLVLDVPLDNVDALGQARIASPRAEAVEKRGRRVEPRQLCRRKPLRERAGDDARPAADIDDMAHIFRIESRAPEPVCDVFDEREYDGTVDLERIRHRVPVEVRSSVMMTMTAHGLDDTASAAVRSPSRALAAALATSVKLDFGESSA